jgi:streptomycin 6-kinase
LSWFTSSRRELGQHAAQVALQRLLGDPHDLAARAAQEALDRVVEQRLLAGQLHVGDAVHVQRDAALRVGALHLDVDRDVGEVDAVDQLEQRHAQRAPPRTTR